MIGCECGADIKEYRNVELCMSLMGKGTTVICTKCHKIIKEGVGRKDKDIPVWIKHEIVEFWNNFDPDKF